MTSKDKPKKPIKKKVLYYEVWTKIQCPECKHYTTLPLPLETLKDKVLKIKCACPDCGEVYKLEDFEIKEHRRI